MPASSPVARDHWEIFELIIKESGSTLVPIIPLSRFSRAREFPYPHLALGKPAEEAGGRAASQGMFFGIFVLNSVSNLSFFVLIRVSIYQFLSQTGYLFLDDKQQNFYKL